MEYPKFLLRALRGQSEIDADPLKSRWISGGCLDVPGFSRPAGKKHFFFFLIDVYTTGRNGEPIRLFLWEC